VVVIEVVMTVVAMKRDRICVKRPLIDRTSSNETPELPPSLTL